MKADDLSLSGSNENMHPNLNIRGVCKCYIFFFQAFLNVPLRFVYRAQNQVLQNINSCSL